MKALSLVAILAMSASTMGLAVPEPRPAWTPGPFTVKQAVGSVTPEEWAEKSAEGLRLVRLALDAEPVWMTEEEKLKIALSRKGVMDITDTYHDRLELAKAQAQSKVAPAPAITYPAISHQTAVKAIITTLSISNMQTNLASLTALNNRYYKSTTGAQATTLVYNTLQSIVGSTTGVSVTQFAHSWGQNSVIVRINGSGTGPITIFGCHLDTINAASPTSGRAPGADDNGTGVVNLYETIRALLAAGFKPVSAVEFHFNSAEEAGLLGSQAIAAAYVKAGTQVKAYIDLDMTAYFKPGTTEIIALVDDYVTANLNTYLRTIISAYCAIPAGTDHCGYECVDSVSWYEQGFPTANPFEATTANSNQLIHSASDTTSVSGFSWTHALEFVKLVVGTAYELGSV